MLPKRLLILIAVGCMTVSARSHASPHLMDKINHSPFSFFSKVNNKSASQTARAEQYIQQYHHFTEVPSTEKAGKNGFALDDNQATWLKMKDEFTLNLISIKGTASKTLLNTVDKK